MIQYVVPQTTTAEYQVATPGISYSNGYDLSSRYQLALPQE